MGGEDGMGGDACMIARFFTYCGSNWVLVGGYFFCLLALFVLFVTFGFMVFLFIFMFFFSFLSFLCEAIYLNDWNGKLDCPLA
jgi:hypothetical protein